MWSMHKIIDETFNIKFKFHTFDIIYTSKIASNILILRSFVVTLDTQNRGLAHLSSQATLSFILKALYPLHKAHTQHNENNEF